MRVIFLLAATCTAVAVAAPARANPEDSLSGLRGLLEERQHRIDVKVAPGHATLVVARTVDNLGRRHVLNEGHGIASLQIARDTPPWLEIAGELWAKPIRVRLSPDSAVSRLWSGLVFGSDVMGDLSEPEMMILARHGGAVSPVTSYLAIEPGVRPSTEGIPIEGTGDGAGGMAEGTITLGNLATIGAGGGGPFDHEAWLREALEPARKRCGFAARPVTIAIESTVDEIVDVPTLTADGPGDRTCLREAAWSVELPHQFKSDHATWTVRFE